MKINKVITCLLFSSLLIGCNENIEEITIEKINHELSIYIASDLHLYSNNLLINNSDKYSKDRFTSDGRVQEYDYELVDSLIKEVNDYKPEYLVLTGDLSYNGEKDSLLELKKKLDTINKDTKVLVIPGNHDCYSVNPFYIENDEIKYQHGVTYDEFKEIFSNYGYIDAYSYDEYSLSYIYELDESNWILMLDTNNTEYNYELSSNIIGGFIEEKSLEWIENNLKYASKNNINVISATHHNLLVHSEVFKTSYTINNYESLLNLYLEYGVKLNLSGHLHIQSIASEIKEDKYVYDIASGSLLDYGNRVGVLDIYSNAYDYKSHKIKFIDESFDFNQYSFDVFYNKYYNKSIVRNKNKYDKNVEEITDLLSKINCYYFDGDYREINKLVEDNKKLIRYIKRNTEDYENSYLESIIEVENKNQHELLIEK